MPRLPFLALCVTLPLLAQTRRPAPATRPTATAARPTPAQQALLQRITPDALRGHVSFLASDLLEGRATPSRGLDLAAEYIAAQFRAAGLKPAGDEGYFQTKQWVVSESRLDGLEGQWQLAGQPLSLAPALVSGEPTSAVSLSQAPVYKVDLTQLDAVARLTPEETQGQVFAVEVPATQGLDEAARRELGGRFQRLQRLLATLRPALVLRLSRAPRPKAASGPALRDPKAPPAPVSLTLHSPEALDSWTKLPAGLTDSRLTLTLPAPTERPVMLRNVIGTLPGRDPALRPSFVLLTAHYDHVGLAPAGEDRVFNGANDDASGTAAVIEIARALRDARPRRTLVFMTYYGEERGLLGSRAYGRVPVFPIADTIANVNLEQVGRTDDTEGPRVSAATVTGFDYSDVGALLARAGKLTGVQVSKHPRFSDAFFGSSDNQALADLGVPAHTFSVAYEFPDYHKVGDHWDKLDYDNMAKVTRTVALAALLLGSAPQPPRWNPNNPKAAPYRTAWEKTRAQPVGETPR